MEIKCPTCGYPVKDSTVCPRCRTKIIDCFSCSGNCMKCPSANMKNDAKK